MLTSHWIGKERPPLDRGPHRAYIVRGGSDGPRGLDDYSSGELVSVIASREKVGLDVSVHRVALQQLRRIDRGF